MRAAAMMLARALEDHGACRILDMEEQLWASALFVGARHIVRLEVAGAAFLDGIEEAEFDLGEHLLADLAVERCEMVGGLLRVTIGALTIEQGGEAGQAEHPEPTRCGTKAAFVPLAAA